MNQEERTYNLQYQSIPRLLVDYTFPAIVGTMVNALYNIVDRIFIGQCVGPDAITGLTLTFPIIIFMQAFGMLVAVGASSKVSILLGQKKNDRADRILGNSIILTILFHLALCIPIIIYLDDLLIMFGANDASLPYAKEYLNIIVPFNILANLGVGYNAIMRASGYPFKAMITMLMGAIVNTILDTVFIMYLHWGIKGAAWATVIAMAVSSVYVMSHFFSKDSIVRFRKKNIRFSMEQIISICSIGVAPFFVQIIGSCTNIIFNRSFAEYSTDIKVINSQIAAYGILNSFAMLGVMLMLGIAQGMQPIVGFNYGAKKYDRVIKTFYFSCGANAIVSFVCLMLALVIPDVVASMFTNDESLIEISSYALSVSLLGFVFISLQVIGTQFFQSIGMGLKALLLSLSRQLIFLLPSIIILPKFFGIKGIWYSMPISDTIAGVMAIFMITMQIKFFRRKMDEPS